MEATNANPHPVIVIGGGKYQKQAAVTLPKVQRRPAAPPAGVDPGDGVSARTRVAARMITRGRPSCLGRRRRSSRALLSPNRRAPPR